MTKWIQDQTNVLINKYGVIVAFSKKQFDGQKQKGVKYVHLGAGVLCPKEAVRSFLKERGKIVKEGIEKEKQAKTAPQIIEEALANYECYYAEDIEDAAEALQDYGYTLEDIWQVFHYTKHKYNF